MEGVVKTSRLNRQGSRLRRQRSQQDWQDYSSSDNEDDIDTHPPYYTEEHEYEDPRNAIDPRSQKHVPDRANRGGRGNSSTSSGRSYSHSSMELLTGRNYGNTSPASNGSEGDLHLHDPDASTRPYPNGLRGGQMTPNGPASLVNSYPNYSSLPRQGRSNSLVTSGTNFRMVNPAGRDGRSPTGNGTSKNHRTGNNGGGGGGGVNRENGEGAMTTSTNRDTSPGAGSNGGTPTASRTRMGLGLRREQSSTSTSDNNSDATYTDSEPMSRRRDMIHESQNVFCDSPPEPAPPLVPSRNLTAVQHIEAFGLRPRLGYLESECESEPPYLPTMLTSPLPAYSQPDLVNGQSKPLLDNNLESNHTENQRNNSQLNNRVESERIYSQPQPFTKGDTTNIPMPNSTSTTTLASNSVITTTVTSAVGGPTYSNPLPVFCSTPSSTTGPMVPVTNCVNPQLIQGPTVAGNNNRAPFSATSAFASSALSTSRFHFRKACNHYCSWKTTCIVLICLVVILTTILAYLAAMSSLNDFPEMNRQCIVMEDQDVPYTATGLPVTAPSNAEHKDGGGGMGSGGLGWSGGNGGGSGGNGKCNLLPNDMSAYQRVSLGDSLFKNLQPRQSWNVWFSHPNSGFIRFNFTVPHGSRLALIGRKNDPPTISAHDFTEVIGDDHRKTYKRTSMLREEVSIVQYLVPGDWYLAIVNDDNVPVDVSLQPNTANDVPTSCPSNCHGHGNCQLGKCHCFPGYIGPDCADSVCPVLCSGHGRYVHGSCRCDVGWKGPECSIPVAECEVADCNGNGLCVEGTCLCNSGFKGDHCEEADCIEPDCSGHGVCVKGQCWCKIGWRGSNCSQADDRLSRCFPDCAGHGVYDLETEKCVCFRHWTGNDCSKAKCNLDCGLHGQCEEGRCHCDNGWTGTKCDSRTCDPRCLEHGQCNNGTCICIQGWMGRHCTLDGCPNGCSNHGRCQRDGEVWACSCDSGWGGKECSVPQETNCRDDMDNDADGLMDCADSECCSDDKCRDSLMCLSSPDPLDILLRKQPPAVTASFYQKMRFLIEEESVQSYAHRDEYTESQFWSAFVKSRVSVIRGQVIGRDGNGLIGIRVSVATDPQFGFTLTRSDGWFDILVNGGSAVTLQFQRNPFHPIKRTVMVPWNDIIVMEPVPMSATASEEPNSLAFGFHEPCVDHDYDVMKPIVYQTWRSGSHGGCTENSAVLTETQVLQESLPILGSDLHLVYHSTHAQGYLSTIHLQLTPSEVPETLRLVHLKIIVEGILFQKTFEADPEIKFTYPWNKRNIYKQKVYGLTVARVFVGFEYSNCPSILWTSQDVTIRGYHMDISELGSWNLDIHHRYNFHEGVLQKGDGTTIYFKQQPRVIKVLMGTGLQRPLLCPECNGLARDNKLLAPVALTSGPDGSVYVGDFNLVRRVTPSGQVYTVFRMKTTEVSYQYHVTLSPTDGHLYISDPERHQILRVHSLDKVEDPDSNFDVVVGSGERCLPRDRENCGDGKPALEARLSYPKGMAVAVDNTLYFADGTNIRMVDNRGIIHTLIGDHHHKRQWRPIPCTGTLKLDEVKLRWPTDLAINPLDGLLYFIDDHMVLKVTKDKRVMVMAGQPVYCKNQNQKNQKSRMTEETTLGSLISFAFGPTGLMYIAEVHSNQVHRIRTMSPDRELLHFAGSETACDCAWTNCTCPSNDKVSLAMDTRLYSITSLTVTSDGVVHFADQGSLRVLSAVPFLPQPDEQQVEFRIAYPDNHEIFVFNKYGQHIATRSILTGKTMYTFLYNVNTSFGKLSAVTDASGNKVSFLRDSGNSLHTIETARGQKCRVQVTKQAFLELFVDPTNLETNFYYDANGLLTSRTDSEGRSFFYLYDDNGRLTEVVKPSGVATSLTFDLSPSGASVSYTEDGGPKQLVVTVKGTTVISEQNGMFLQTTVHQDGTIEVETPWKVGGVWETAPHSVLREVLPVQAGMFAVPVKQVLYYGMEPTSILDWHYDVKYNRREKGKEDKATSAVERVLSVNGTQFLTVEYDWVAGREILYNSSRRPCLVVQYDSFSRPIQWLPTDTRVPLNVMYDRQGRLSGWQHGTLTETYGYDRLGHLSDLKYTDNHVVKLTYEGRAMPSKVILPSGRAYTFHFDDNGGLKQIATPKGTRHTFLGHISIGFHKFFYTPPGNGAPYVVLFNDMKFPILKIFPGDLGRVLYRYVNQTLLKSIVFGGGKVERNYTIAGFVESELWSDDRVEVISEYGYANALLTHSRVKYSGKFQLSNLTFVYSYDKGARLRSLATRLEALQLKSVEFGYSPVSGKLTQFGNFRVFERATNDSVISDGTASFARQTDSHHRFRQLSLIISDKEVYRMDLQYDNRNYVTQTKMFVRSLGTSKIRQQNYSYDEDGQLIDTTGKEKWKFNYDQNGNMITMQYQAKRIDILYDAGDRIVSFGETPYLVDGRGYVIQRGEERFFYNVKGQLIRASKNGRFNVEYAYDARGRLAVRKDNFGNLTQFFYANPLKPHLLTHVYNNADGRFLILLYDDSDYPVLVMLNKESFYVACDCIGTPVVVFDKFGEVVKEFHRGPYGHVMFDSNPHFYLPVDFQGGILDPFSGLIHFGERVYDPMVGQWMSPGWDDVLRNLNDPRGLHLYRFNKNDPINKVVTHRNKLEMDGWTKAYGIDVHSLQLAAPDLFHSPYSVDPSPLYLDMPSIPLVSGFACSVRKKIENFAKLSIVEGSKVKKDQLYDTVVPKISTLSVPFGKGIVVSLIEGRAVVRTVGDVDPIRRDAVTSVFNNSYLLDLHLIMHGQDVFYFVKENTWRVGDDLNQLQRLGNMINTTVHESKTDEERGSHHVDIRVHAYHAILNIRYGTTLPRERQRLLRHAKKHAVGLRWALERELVQANHQGSRDWTEKEKEHILSANSVPGYRGDYYHDVKYLPELADDPSNIVFHKTSEKHR